MKLNEKVIATREVNMIIYRILVLLSAFFKFIHLRLEKRISNYHYTRLRWFCSFNFENLTSFIVFILFVSFFCMFDFNVNIQKVHVKKQEIKIDHEYIKLKSIFKWLEKDVYYAIKKECEKNEIDPVLLMSVIQYESGDYCKNEINKMTKVVSYAGAIGICQIMPFHAKNPMDLYDYRYNIKKGAWYLSACLEASGGNVREAARRYNQGIHGNPKRYKNWAYVNRINRKYKYALTNKVMAVR